MRKGLLTADLQHLKTILQAHLGQIVLASRRLAFGLGALWPGLIDLESYMASLCNPAGVDWQHTTGDLFYLLGWVPHAFSHLCMVYGGS